MILRPFAAPSTQGPAQQVEAQIVDDPPRQPRRKLLIRIAECCTCEQTAGQTGKAYRQPCAMPNAVEQPGQPPGPPRGAKYVETAEAGHG